MAEQNNQSRIGPDGRLSHESMMYKGMNKDFYPDNLPNVYYFDGKNIRLFPYQTDSFGGVINIKGHKFGFSLPTGQIIISACYNRDIITIFTTDNQTINGGNGWIYTFTVDDINLTVSAPELKYFNSQLGFTTLRPIESYMRYESDKVLRVYWNDWHKPIRGINLLNIDATDPIEIVDLFQNIPENPPLIYTINNGGVLPPGVYEYFYALITKDGKKSIYSPSSKQIHITDTSEGIGSSANYRGMEKTDSEGELNSTGKSVTLKLDLSVLPSDVYKEIVVGVIYKTDYYQVPIVREIKRLGITYGQLFQFTHTGNENTQIDISYEDYLINQYPFYAARTITENDDTLFAGNIKKEPFYISDDDWNPITVRWRNLDGQLAHHGEINPFDGDGNFNNPFNDESGKANGRDPFGDFETWRSDHQFKYQLDGVTLGGESPLTTPPNQRVKYRFTLRELIGDSNSGNRQLFSENPFQDEQILSFNDGEVYVNRSFNGFSSPYIKALFMNFKRGEVYRIGAVGVSKKGAVSFVKFIGDIKFPEVSDEAGYETIPGTGITNFPISRLDGGITYLYSLGLELEINIPPSIQNDVEYIQIVRAVREEKDKTRAAQGVINRYCRDTTDSSITNRYRPFGEMTDIEQFYMTEAQYLALDATTERPFFNRQIREGYNRLVNFYTPEMSYDFNVPKKSNNDYLKTVAILENTTKYPQNDITPTIFPGSPFTWGQTLPLTAGPLLPLFNREFITKAKSTAALSDAYDAANYAKIKDLIKGENPFRYMMGGIEPHNAPFIINQTDSEYEAKGGRALIIDFGEGMPMDAGYTDDLTLWKGKALLVDYVRRIDNQYGGIGPSAFQSNQWIECSAPFRNTDVNIKTEIFDGDTFVNMFEFMSCYWNNENPQGDQKSFYESVIFPVESSINIDLNSGYTFTEGTGGYDHDDDGEFEGYRSQEKNNRFGDMFNYNPVYSSARLSRTYVAEPKAFVLAENISHRIHLSDVKIAGESVDAWSIFRPAAFYDLIASAGPITKLINLKDTVIFLQYDGVGGLSFNPTAVINAEGIGPTQLGTAKGIQDKNYFSMNYGCISQWAVVSTGESIIFPDLKRKKLFEVGGNQSTKMSLSEGLGFHSFMTRELSGEILLTKEEGGDNPIIGKGVTGTYDFLNRQALFSFFGTTKLAHGSTPLKDWDEELPIYSLIMYDNSLYVVNTPFTPSGADNLTELELWIFLYCTEVTTEFLNQYTISYNILTGSFESFYGFRPRIYASNDTHVLSPDPDTPNDLYLHNAGEFGVFYDNPAEECFITFRVNTPRGLNKILELVEYGLLVTNINTQEIINNHPLTAIRIKNDYQDTGKIILSTVSDRYHFQKFRKWRFNRIFNEGSLARMSSTYHDVTLYYDNLSGYQVNLSSVVNYLKLQKY